MKTEQHTQGEWKVKTIYFPETKVQRGMHIYSEQKYDEREICDLWGSATEEGQANAKLIAAAPILLEACINSLKSFIAIGCTEDSEIVKELVAVIKKVTV